MYGNTPKGLNPTLYAAEDLVLQLDDNTFNDTIFCVGEKCTSYLVEFYSDWCGHCRSFAPLYKALANDVRGWQDVVKIAAINCADSVVMDDYAVNRFSDWPMFDYLGDVVTYGELWEGAPPSTQYMAIIFENHQSSLTGAQGFFYGRIVSNYGVIWHICRLRRLLLAELENFLKDPSEQSVQFHSRKNRTNPCDADPEKCRALYYVSEVDMLKAIRYALFRETSRTNAPLAGSNLTALHAFVNLLADYFPVSTSYGNDTALDRSTRAVKVFARLRDYLENRGLDSTITPEEWQREFIAAEESAGNPFTINSDWEHCKGSSGQYRGYTCGLWVTFHTLTVSAYKQAEEHCEYFGYLKRYLIFKIHDRLQATSSSASNSSLDHIVKNPEDVVMYLWRAHNIVNARLHGRDTEDPQFPKVQFPAKFLCSNCTTTGSLTDKQTRDFLIDYYSQIKPFQTPKFLLK
ncbi:unnamed protein product [Strongylus vulgaris]|uniref:Sulfhydryl oxidase n=1 Tax=Strongylus vulgaris TaxID=40348 RepID=A0A3P7J438_STRVU|nr:unnamed protein product [Strongylus vulgaris]